MITRLAPKKIVLVVGAVAALLLAAHFLGLFSKHVLGYTYAKGFVPMFDLDHEQNVPTFFSSFLLLSCAGLLGLIAAARRREQRDSALGWIGLALAFAFLAYDEMAAVHEGPVRAIKDAVQGASGLADVLWLLPLALLAAVLLTVYARFLMHLSGRTRLLFIIAGLAYVGGAVVVDTLTGNYLQLHGVRNLTYDLLATLEEGLEISGAILFLYALLRHLSLEFSHLAIGLALPTTGPETESGSASIRGAV